MTELLRIPVGTETGAGYLFVEITDDEPGMEQVSRTRDRVYEAAQSLRQALEPIRLAASEALSVFQAIEPSTVEVEFGVKLHAKTGAILTEAGAEGHLKVTLTWQKEESGG
ncbi:CU044_2847 family protein [Streptomyces niveus]|uniref:CU044_2847 family protein n=1 Tax=Streptomyces niveus TaxID=193462 RepID=UPI0036D3B779